MQKKRLFYLDNLKIFLTFLVVVHHVGQPYGGSNGFWYFVSQDHVPLGRFFSVNAGFFMSLFFLISAYFLPASLERKGTKLFLKDRFKRLGIPLLFGFFVIMPVLMYVYYIHYRQYGYKPFWSYYINVYFGLAGEPKGWTGPSFPDFQFGHMWFIEHLLVYALIYACLRLLFQRKERPSTFLARLTNGKLFLLTVFTGLVTFLVRVYKPIDHWEGFLGFIQVEYAHLPQYVMFFTLGILAYKHQYLEQLKAQIGIPWFVIGGGIAVLRYTTDVFPYSQGGWNTANLFYSLVETYLCFGLGFGLLFLFNKVVNFTNSFLKLLSDNSFSVYIFHFPNAVLMQFLFAQVPLQPFLKFAVVSLLTITTTYLFSYIIRKSSVIRSII